MILGRSRVLMVACLLGVLSLTAHARSNEVIYASVLTPAAGPDRIRSRDTEPEKLQKDLQKIINRIAAATVRVDTFDGMGSGTIIDKEGHIVTSAHVIEGGRRVTVTLTDGRRFRAKVLGINSAGDLALLDIDADHLKPAIVGNSDFLKTQQWVVAVGHPVSAFDDFQPTVSIGLIRKVDAVIRADRRKVFHSTIVSDTPLSPGSSGGGLFDLKGRLVGVNAAVTRNERGAFSVRINEFLKDKKRLLRGEHFDRLADDVVLSRAERDRTSRTRTQYFSANCRHLKTDLEQKQVSIRRGNVRLSGLVVSAQGDVLAPAKFFVNDEPGNLFSVYLNNQFTHGEVASLLSVDQTAGVALLRLPERSKCYPHFDLSKETLVQRGQLALVKHRDWMRGGIVGATNRTPPLDMTNYVYRPNLTQVDLRMSAADRGAPVVGLGGELIGMVFQPRLQDSRENSSLAPYGAFILPVAVLRESYAIIRDGHSRGTRPVGFLGVELEDMTESQRARYDANTGVRVARADRGYPAYAAGIRRGDIITSIAGRSVNSKGTAVSQISSLKRGDEVVIAVIRRHRNKAFRVTLIDRADAR